MLRCVRSHLYFDCNLLFQFQDCRKYLNIASKEDLRVIRKYFNFELRNRDYKKCFYEHENIVDNIGVSTVGIPLGPVIHLNYKD